MPAVSLPGLVGLGERLEGGGEAEAGLLTSCCLLFQPLHLSFKQNLVFFIHEKLRKLNLLMKNILDSDNFVAKLEYPSCLGIKI
jgi:hypothetical protein